MKRIFALIFLILTFLNLSLNNNLNAAVENFVPFKGGIYIENNQIQDGFFYQYPPEKRDDWAIKLKISTINFTEANYIAEYLNYEDGVYKVWQDEECQYHWYDPESIQNCKKNLNIEKTGSNLDDYKKLRDSAEEEAKKLKVEFNEQNPNYYRNLKIKNFLNEYVYSINFNYLVLLFFVIIILVSYL